MVCGVTGALARISTCIPALPRTTATFFTLTVLPAFAMGGAAVAAAAVSPPVTLTKRA